MMSDNEMKVILRSRSGNEALSRMVVSAFLVQADPTLEELEDIKTAVSEAVTNCIVHGYGIDNASEEAVIEMNMTLKDRDFEISVTDRGRGIEDVKKAMEAFYSGDPDGERSGMGFTIMQTFMSELKVESALQKGTVVRMRKILSKR